MIDSELFELCKEVRRRTNWIDTDQTIAQDPGNPPNRRVVSTQEFKKSDGLNYGFDAPLYTSDYLLEKLLPHTSIRLLKRADGYIDVQYDAELPDYNDYSSSDIRITLLKLVIALDDAGVKL